MVAVRPPLRMALPIQWLPLQAILLLLLKDQVFFVSQKIVKKGRGGGDGDLWEMREKAKKLTYMFSLFLEAYSLHRLLKWLHALVSLIVLEVPDPSRD